MQKERDKLIAMQPHAAEEQLMEILRDKDQQILNLELDIRKEQAEKDLVKEKVHLLEKDILTYVDTISVKDQSIVKLTNEIHELDLTHKLNQTTNSIRNVYSEKVSVGSQTDLEKTKGRFQDTVTSFIMFWR